MMMSPGAYEEFHLKGKNGKEILSAIRGLKRNIGQYKKEIEGRRFQSDYVGICPSPDVCLLCEREYLQRAKDAYEALGEKYMPSKAEQKAITFQENIEHISKITLTIGGFFGGWKTYQIDCSKEDNAETLSGIADLYMGEWLPNYDPSRFGVAIMDGTQWDLKVEYDNGLKPFKSSGSNDYPWNFENLLELFGIQMEL